MPNRISFQGSLSIGDGTYDSSTPNLNWEIIQTGSGYIGSQTQTITSGSWQGLTFTSSLQNGLYVTEIRNTSTGSVKLAGSSVGAGINPIIPPGGFNVYTFPGAGFIQQLFAQAMVANSSSILHSCGGEK